jgi:multidrug efflux pump subunit AcrB
METARLVGALLLPAAEETKLADLADLRARSHAPQGFARFDGKPAALLLCRGEPGTSPGRLRSVVGDLAADVGVALRRLGVTTSTLDLTPGPGAVPFVAALELPAEADLSRAMDLTSKIEKRLFGLPGLESMAVTLKERALLLLGRISEQDIATLVERLRELPKVHVRFAPFRDTAGAESPFGFGELVRIRGRSSDAVDAVARRLIASNQHLGPPIPPIEGPPQLVAVVDLEAARAHGLKPDAVQREAELAVQGWVRPATKAFPQIVVQPAGDREPARALASTTIPAGKGAVPLKTLARVEIDVGLPEMAFVGTDRVVYLSVEDANAKLDLGLPFPGVAVERLHWRKLSLPEQALIASVVLP